MGSVFLKQEAEDLNFKRNVEIETGRIHRLVSYMSTFHEKQYLPLVDRAKKVESLPTPLNKLSQQFPVRARDLKTTSMHKNELGRTLQRKHSSQCGPVLWWIGLV